MSLWLRRLLLVEWSGLAAAIVAGAGALAFIAPNFLTEFNLYVMLRSLSVPLLVAFAQMITLGVGQMNIAVGAIGGLVAIAFGGMMEVYGVPLGLAIPLALAIGALSGLINGLLIVRTGINAFIITLATGSAFTAGAALSRTNPEPAFSPTHRRFQEYSFEAAIPRSRQNSATVLPLWSCSEISPRHFASASAPRALIPSD